MTKQKYKVQSTKYRRRSTSGQSLIEVLVGLSIGGVLIVAAVFAIAAILQTNLTLQKSQGAAGLNQELLDRVSGFASADWQNVAGLPAGATTSYFLAASGTATFAVAGQEGVLDNDVRSGLAGHWGFDEASGTAAFDLSGGGAGGALVGISDADRATGTVGRALEFAPFGSGKAVRIGQTARLNPTSSLSVTAWIKVNGYQPDAGNWQTVFEGSGNLNSNSGFYLGFDGWSSDLDFRVGSGSGWLVAASIAQTEVPLGVWTHVAGVMTATSAQMYVNGVKKYDAPRTAGTAQYESYPLTIGSLAYAVGEHILDGTIDDVRLYNRALSADEVLRVSGSNVFTRSFSVENVCRTTDASSTIAGVMPCAGGTVRDPSMLAVSAATHWQVRGASGEVRANEYLARSRNSVLWQTDWSGGAVAGPLTGAGNGFAASSGIGISNGGSLRILGF